MITRRPLISGLAGGLFAVPRRGTAQPAPRRVRIGVLANQDNPMWQGFRRGLNELGYIDGRNATIEWRWSGGHPGRLPVLATELTALDVDVIVVSGTQAALAAKQATKRIPIVMALSSYPDRMGLVESLARPGGNITGLTTMAPELMGKRLELLMAVAPAAPRVALLFNPASPVDRLSLQELQAAATVLRARILPVEVHTPEDFTAAFSTLTTGRAQAMVVIGNPIAFRGRQPIVEFALAHRLPSMFEERLFVDAGGLMSYAPSFVDMFRRAADYVDKVLNGTRPADLPVEQPTKFELVVNLKTAKALGITIPRTVLLRADEVLQ